MRGALFGGRKKKALKRVKLERVSDRDVVTNREGRSLARAALILLVFALLVVLIEQVFFMVRTGGPLAPVRRVG